MNFREKNREFCAQCFEKIMHVICSLHEIKDCSYYTVFIIRC